MWNLVLSPVRLSAATGQLRTWLWQPTCRQGLGTFTGLSVPSAERRIKIRCYLQESFVICLLLASNDLILQCDRKRTELNHYWHTQYLLLEITSHQNISNICTEMPPCS